MADPVPSLPVPWPFKKYITICSWYILKISKKSVSQHEGAWSRGGVRGGCPPPGTAAVSKHEIGTVTKQTTGARGEGLGGVPPPARLLCPSMRQIL